MKAADAIRSERTAQLEAEVQMPSSAPHRSLGECTRLPDAAVEALAPNLWIGNGRAKSACEYTGDRVASYALSRVGTNTKWLKLGSGVGWRCAYQHFRGAGREPREENFGATLLYI